MRIDSHVHILPPEFIKNIDKNMERDEHFKLLHSSPKAKFATAEGENAYRIFFKT